MLAKHEIRLFIPRSNLAAEKVGFFFFLSSPPPPPPPPSPQDGSLPGKGEFLE